MRKINPNLSKLKTKNNGNSRDWWILKDRMIIFCIFIKLNIKTYFWKIAVNNNYNNKTKLLKFWLKRKEWAKRENRAAEEFTGNSTLKKTINFSIQQITKCKSKVSIHGYLANKNPKEKLRHYLKSFRRLTMALNLTETKMTLKDL